MSDQETTSTRERGASHPLGRMWGWTYRENGRRAFRHVLAILAAGFLLGELALHRHAYLGLEGLFGFYAIFGFLAFAFVVLTGAPLRKFLGRKEDYYDTPHERGEGPDGCGVCDDE